MHTHLLHSACLLFALGVQNCLARTVKIERISNCCSHAAGRKQAAQLNSPAATCDSALVPTNVVCPRNSNYSPQLLCCDGCSTCGQQCPLPIPPGPLSSPGSSDSTTPTPPTPPGDMPKPPEPTPGGGDSTPSHIIVPVCVIGGLLVLVAFYFLGWPLLDRYFPTVIPPPRQPPHSHSQSPP